MRYFFHTVKNVLSLHLSAEKLRLNTDCTKLRFNLPVYKRPKFDITYYRKIQTELDQISVFGKYCVRAAWCIWIIQTELELLGVFGK